jgi:TatD DNase family protein
VEFIDSHAHLADPAFDADRDEVIARARQTGAVGMVCIASTASDGERAASVATANPGFVACTAGHHPHEAASFDPARDLPLLREQLERGAVAVGECGLDYHYDTSPRTAQRRAFAEQLVLARDTGRPVVVHTRDAAADTAAMITEAAAAGVRGVLHCFTGPLELAEAALAAGWHLSFSGIVTFPRFTDDALLRLAPDDRILAESDAPYLAPVPHRGKRNEPAWVTFTIARLAAARGVEPAAMAALTTENTRRFFALARAE